MALTLKDMQERAGSKGGRCLSRKYKGVLNKLKWVCKKGHVWKATPASVKNGHWCPICARFKWTIEDMRRFAENKSGKCLSREYKRIQDRLKWQCKEGHIWYSRLQNIKEGCWCPVCAGRPELTVEKMQKLVEKEGGKCLSKGYINHYTQIKWQCKKGHTWESPYNYVKMGYWCPVCSKRKPLRPNIDSEILLKSLRTAYKKRVFYH